MPTQTFFNLPENKRQTITDNAIAEFATHDYANASITQIVKQSKIAKGSFYQYFENKKELYLYLIDLATQQKLNFLQKANPPQPKMGFFPYLRWIFEVGTQFDLTHPALKQIFYRAIYGDLPFRDEVLEITQGSSLQYIETLVRQGVEQGDIATDIEPEFAAFVITALGEGLGKFIPKKLGLDAKQITEQGVDIKAVKEIFDDLFRVLEYGLSRQTEQPESIISEKRE
ncbi:MAG: TetR/AcrR family transcriptional regulator [Spirulinaceae cyanobacterium]